MQSEKEVVITVLHPVPLPICSPRTVLIHASTSGCSDSNDLQSVHSWTWVSIKGAPPRGAEHRRGRAAPRKPALAQACSSHRVGFLLLQHKLYVGLSAPTPRHPHSHHGHHITRQTGGHFLSAHPPVSFPHQEQSSFLIGQCFCLSQFSNVRQHQKQSSRASLLVSSGSTYSR